MVSCMGAKITPGVEYNHVHCAQFLRLFQQGFNGKESRFSHCSFVNYGIFRLRNLLKQNSKLKNTANNSTPVIIVPGEASISIEQLIKQCAALNESCAVVICGKRPADAAIANLGWPTEEVSHDMAALTPGSIYIAPAGKSVKTENGRIILAPSIAESNISANEELIRLRALFNNSDEGISIINPQGFAFYISPAAERILGYTIEELVKIPLMEKVHPNDQAHVIQTLQESFAKPGVKLEGGIVRMLHKDGDWRWCDANITNMIHDPAIGGILDNFRDVTELVNARRESELHQKNTEALINSSSNAMWIVDKKLRLIHFNDIFAERVKDLTGQEVRVGKTITELTDIAEEGPGFWPQQYARVFASETVRFEQNYTDPITGKRVWMSTQLTPVSDYGNIYGVAGCTTDISGIIAHSLELEQLNKKLVQAQRIAKLGYWKLTSIEDMTVEWGDEIFEIMEWRKGEGLIDFARFRDAVYPDDLAYFDEVSAEALGGAKSFEINHRVITGNNNVNWIRHSGISNCDAQGVVQFMEGSTQDITEFKLTEIALAERTAFIETAVDNLPIGIAVNKIATGAATLVNKQFSEIYGWPAEEISAIEDFFEKVYPDPEFREKIKTRIFADMSSGDPDRMIWREIPITAKDGTQKIVDARNIPVSDQGLMISTVIDVTENVRSREALLISNQRFEYACKASFDVMWDYDVEKERIYWGAGLEQHFGHKLKGSESGFDFWTQHIHPEDYERVLRGFENAIQNADHPIWEENYRLKKANGVYAFVVDRGHTLHNEKGEVYRVVGAIQDVTESKVEELKLRLRESVIDNTKEAVIIAEALNDDEDRMVFVNESLLQMLGYQYHEVIGLSAELFFRNIADKKGLKQFKKAKEANTPFEIELPAIRKNGKKFWMSFSMSPVPDEKGLIAHYVFIISDITDRRAYVNLLTKQNKKFKEIAFTQSHVVRAPLARLMGLVNVLSTADASDEDFVELLNSIKLSAEELDKIIREIVHKARGMHV